MSDAPISRHIPQPLDNQPGKLELSLVVQASPTEPTSTFWRVRSGSGAPRSAIVIRQIRLRRDRRLGLVATLEDGRRDIAKRQHGIYGLDTHAAVIRTPLCMSEFGDKLGTFDG